MTQPKSSLQDPNDFVLVWDDAEPAPDTLTDDEVQEILSVPQGEGLNDAEVNAILNSLVAAGDMHTGAMIALRPSMKDIERISFVSDEPADELHCTMLYLGEAALIDEQTQDQIIGLASRYSDIANITANGFSVAVFNPQGDESCLVLQVGDSTTIEYMRDSLFKAITQIMGTALPKQYVPFVPHVTLSYTDDTSLIPRLTHLTGPITFDAIRIAFAGEIIDIEFESEDTDD
jgi:2'-5' RNA ligase